MDAADSIKKKKLTPRDAWLLILEAISALNKSGPEGALSEGELGNLEKAQDLLYTLISLTRVKEGKEHELGGNGEALADSLWLLEPLEKALQFLHTQESTNDQGSHFLELLCRKLAFITEAARHGKEVEEEDVTQVRGFFSSLANQLLFFSTKSR